MLTTPQATSRQVPQAATPTPAATRTSSPAEIYRALRSQREVLGEQRSELEQQRSGLTSQLNQTPAGLATESLQKRITAMDERLIDLDKQIATSETAVAQAAAVPGATVRLPDPPRNGPPEEVYELVGMFMVVTLLPLSIAWARRIWRRAARVMVSLPPETDQRVANLERGIEAIALEVERIGEGQRYVTQVLAEKAPRMIEERR